MLWVKREIGKAWSESVDLAAGLLEKEKKSEVGKEEREIFVKQVREWASLNTDALLDKECLYFEDPSIPGFIGYRIDSSYAIVFGDPVCASEHKHALASSFNLFCKKQGLSIVYAIVSESFVDIAKNTHTSVSLQFGNKLILRPSNNQLSRTGSKGGLVRKKVKHAKNESVVIHEYLGNDSQVEKAIEQIGLAWLHKRNGPQVYIAHLSFFSDREGKRWFYAQQGDHLVGVVILNQVNADAGWLLNNLIITPDAPNGTSELLIATVFQQLEEENCDAVIVGPITAKELEKVDGLGGVASRLLRFSYKFVKRLFRLDGQGVFWEKFQSETEPSYLLFEELSLGAVRALLRTMNARV